MKRLLLSLSVALSFISCSSSAPAPAEQPKPPAEIPITSKSPEAIDHFKKGRDLSDNLRNAEAAQELDQAIALDPDFAQALAYRSGGVPGPEGLKDLEQASAKAGAASKPEQLLIAALLSGRQADFAKSQELWKQLTDAVPEDWRTHMGRGAQLYVLQKYRDALEALNKATALNPNAGPAYNMIGYAHLVQGEAGPAVEALSKYASLAPSEPNPHDSLGEALMANGQFAEAEAAFQKAISLSPKFDVAWQGVAYTKFFRGDWAGGQAAVAKAHDASSRGSERLSAARLGAYGKLAEGKTAEGLSEIDVLAKSPDASATDVAFASVDRAGVLVESGRYRDAVAGAAQVLRAADGGQLPTGDALNVRNLALAVTAAAQGRMGDKAGAQQTVATLQKQVEARPDDPFASTTLHFAQGMLAVAEKDMKAARMHFEMCLAQDFACHWQALEVSRRAGDKAGAEAAGARLTRLYVRAPLYVYARARATRGATQTQTND
jgi:tetratricopeptide (TPR) repeat protein